jgi:hypothetical protein
VTSAAIFAGGAADVTVLTGVGTGDGKVVGRAVVARGLAAVDGGATAAVVVTATVVEAAADDGCDVGGRVVGRAADAHDAIALAATTSATWRAKTKRNAERGTPEG